jgi:hypothetical protein
LIDIEILFFSKKKVSNARRDGHFRIFFLFGVAIYLAGVGRLPHANTSYEWILVVQNFLPCIVILDWELISHTQSENSENAFTKNRNFAHP